MAAVCFKPGGGAIVEAPFVSWDPLTKQGYWCMPCCILEDDNHSKMKSCSEIPTEQLVLRHHNIHGRCGIDFNPSNLEDENSKLSPENCRAQRDLERRVPNPYFHLNFIENYEKPKLPYFNEIGLFELRLFENFGIKIETERCSL